ncbi:MAG: glutamate--tRNA ligase, partial [Asticcacaulis sp.]
FAPSPTGYLHIGGARTALFNWLYAKARNGKFLLRVEDTDRERSTESAVQAIFDGLDWLGLQADEPPVFQFARADRHRAVLQTLLETGRAYRCFMSAEETEAARETARAQGHALRSSWRDRTPDADQIAQPHVIRFKGPLEGEVLVADAVQGDVRFNARDLDDLVLLRSDGAPTYNLAVVVDDHDMGVTHVIRGDDHLNNAARQSLIYDALDWARPVFAHIPLIHGPDGAKLSKRHGAQAVGDYDAMGYLPEAMRNYLVRLGWSHGDAEIFGDDEAIAWFDLDGIGRAPARLDFDKLAFVNAHWMREADPARLEALVIAHLEAAGETPSNTARARVQRAIPLVIERAKTVPDLVEQLRFALASSPLVYDDKAQKSLNDEAKGRISRLIPDISSLDEFSPDALDAALKAFAEKEGIGFGKIGPVVRAALTGGLVAPDLGKTLSALGKEESLNRLNDALSVSV